VAVEIKLFCNDATPDLAGQVVAAGERADLFICLFISGTVRPCQPRKFPTDRLGQVAVTENELLPQIIL
jgi:hypothetical protein